MSIREKLYNYIKENGLKEYPREEFADLISKTSWTRVMRQLRQDGVIDYEWVGNKSRYKINEINDFTTTRSRSGLTPKDLYRIRQRDNHRCQVCGKGVKDGVKLHVDHTIPIDMGGSHNDENLCLRCDFCRQGKKKFFNDDLDTEMMKLVLKENSGYQRLKVLFENSPNKLSPPPSFLQGIAKIRDWTRTVRTIREKENMDIKFVRESKKYPNGGYTYEN